MRLLVSALTLLSGAFLFFLVGALMTATGARPATAVLGGLAEIIDFKKHWRNDLGLEPTRFLVEAHPVTPPLAEGRATPGYRLIAGYMAGRESFNGAVLLDEDGEEIHFWPIDYDRLDTAGRATRQAFLHGLEVLPDGSLVVNFDHGWAMARIDPCGGVVWRRDGNYHHAISRAEDGSLWTLEGRGIEQILARIDPEDGSVLREIALVDDVIAAHGAADGIFRIRAEDGRRASDYMHDPFHLNDIEVLPASLAPDFPDFDAGDIMISLRSLNLVVVLDGEGLEPKWWQHGPWHRQHDPDFLPGGTISVFDNNMHGGASRIVEIDPVSRATRDLYRGSPDAPFYTWRRGKHQHLPGGNILITEPEAGRAFEVTRDGTLVWTFENRFDETRNLILNKAMHLPTDFFAGGPPSCGS